ncbi:MAG: 3-deoxy-D-manno-octulosonic acid transferase, partial [Acidobacteriota bacterium]
GRTQRSRVEQTSGSVPCAPQTNSLLYVPRQVLVLRALMYFVYSLLLGLGFSILLPRFVIDAFRHGKYVSGFRERLGSVSPIPNHGRPVIWLHCVSVGETQAARPLVKGIKARFPNHSIVVSTITLTGQHLAREIFKDDVERVFYFPFDWRWVVRRTLNVINPDAVLLMETELWPGFLRECQRRQIPVAMVNGRLSDQSFRRYRLIKGFMKRVLGSLSMAIMQTEADAERLGALGMSESKTFIAGNLKFDAGSLLPPDKSTSDFSERFGLGRDSPVILAASTHSPEERIILAAFKRITSVAKPRLIFAPRHPERFAEVAGIIKASGFRWTRRSSPVNTGDRESEVILLDSIGELQPLYPLASVVFVGGSIAKTGGHNILEPAAVGACVVTGPYTYNFRLIVETFVEAEAVVQLPRVDEPELTGQLANILSELLADAPRRHELGDRAKHLVKRNLGATERTLELLQPMLNPVLSSRSNVQSPAMDSLSTAGIKLP